MSKLTPTKRGIVCPICDDATGKCRITDNNLYLCMSSPDGLIQVSGYKFVNSTKNGDWGIYAEDKEQNFGIDSKRRGNYKAEKINREAAQKAKYEASLNLLERNREYHKLLDQLTLNERDRHDLERRGLNAEQIERGLFRSVSKWHPLANAVNAQLAGTLSNGTKLNVGADGYLVPIPNIDGLIVGSQYRVANPIDGAKYPWLTSRTKKSPDGNQPNLPNGEIPIGVYRPQNLIRKGVVGTIEGYLKPYIGCEKVEHICLGTSSGNFASSPEQVKQALEIIEHEQGVKPYLLLYPDAGAIQNPHVMDTYIRNYKLACKLGYTMRVAWWEQTSKENQDDIDELADLTKIKEISWYEFMGLQYKALRDRTVVLNQKFLGDLDIPEFAKLVGIRSPKHTNKTGAIAKHISNNRDKKRLAICHRSQLTQQLGHRFGLRTHYELENATGDIKEAITIEISLFGMVTTWDSLHKINPNDWQDCEIILDEAEQSVWHFLNADTEIDKHRVDTIALFSQLVQSCDRTILMDADLSNTAIDKIIGLTNREDFKQPYIIENIYQFSEPWQIYLYEENSPDHIFAKLLEKLGSGKKCLLHLDSQKHKGVYSGVNIEKRIKELFPHLRVLLIDGSTVGNPEHPACRILADEHISDRLADYDLVIATPVIETGVSIERKGLFDAVFGIFWGVTSADSVRQALARYRETVDRHVWVRKTSSASGYPNWKDALTSQNKTTRAHIRKLQDADLGHIDIMPSQSALHSWAKMQSRVKCDGLRFRDAVMQGLEADGHIINLVDSGSKDVLVIAIAEDMKANRDESYSAKNKAISDRKTTKEEAEKIEIKTLRTEAEAEALRNYQLGDRYQVEITPELVEADDNGLYGQLRLYYYLTMGRTYLKPRDKAKLKDSCNDKRQVWTPSLNRRLLTAQIELIEELNIPKLIGKELRGSDADMIQFGKAAIKRSGDIRSRLGIKISKLADKPIQIAKLIFSKLGLKVDCVNRDKLPNGKKAGQRVYSVEAISHDDIRHQILQNWLTRDNQKYSGFDSETINQTVVQLDPTPLIINTIKGVGSISDAPINGDSPAPLLPDEAIATTSPTPKKSISVFDFDKLVRDIHTNYEGILHSLEMQGDRIVARFGGQVAYPEFLELVA